MYMHGLYSWTVVLAYLNSFIPKILYHSIISCSRFLPLSLPPFSFALPFSSYHPYGICELTFPTFSYFSPLLSSPLLSSPLLSSPLLSSPLLSSPLLLFLFLTHVHIVFSVNLEVREGQTLHVNMLPNPSHLEAVSPVSMGKTRARQLSQRAGPYSSGPYSSHFSSSDNKPEFENKVHKRRNITQHFSFIYCNCFSILLHLYSGPESPGAWRYVISWPGSFSRVPHSLLPPSL